jgi:hypothetical protein
MSNDDTPKLALDTIDSGAIMQATDRALGKISEDVIRDPLNVGERKVTVTISVKPQLLPSDDLKTTVNLPEVEWSIATAFPRFKGGKSVAFVADNEIRLNPWDSDNPNQMGLSGLDADDFAEETKLADEEDDGRITPFEGITQEGAQE